MADERWGCFFWKHNVVSAVVVLWCGQTDRQTDAQTDADECFTSAIVVGVSNKKGFSFLKQCITQYILCNMA